MEHLNLKQVIETADQLQRTLQKLIISNHGLHPETAVASSARMAGTMLLRDLMDHPGGHEAGSSPLSGDAGRPASVLAETLFATLGQLGHGDLDEQGVRGSRASTALSHLSLGETQAILEPWYHKTADGSQLSLREVAASAAIATALLIHDCRDLLDVRTGCAIATHGFVEPLMACPAGPIPAGRTARTGSR